MIVITDILDVVLGLCFGRVRIFTVGDLGGGL